MNVLFTTPFLEHPPAGGPQLRSVNSIRALAAECRLIVASRDNAASTTQFMNGPFGELAEAVYQVPMPTNSPMARRLRRLVRLPAVDEAETSARFIADLVRRHDVEVAWFSFGNISYPLIQRVQDAVPTLKIVCDTDSVWSRFVLREVPFQPDGARRRSVEHEGRLKEAEERAWVDSCDITTAVSQVDADYYRSIAKDPERVRVFSNGIHIEQYKALPTAPADLVHPALYLAGTFGHDNSPMDMACRWVLEEVLPLVKNREPSVILYVVGRNSDTRFGHIEDPAVVVKGRVDSVMPYLGNADVALVPLKFESGTRFKILEAGACGVPIVSTTLGAEGIPVVDGVHLLLADDAESFADAVVRVISDQRLAASLAANCSELVRENYGLDALRREAVLILRTFEPPPD